MAGIRDVARESGLAVATVSRYLNGQIQLSPATKHRLEAAVQKLNYTPNAIARRLSSGSSETLGLMVTDISYPFFAAVASAAEQEATAQGYVLAIFNSRNDMAYELSILSHLHDRQLDGIAMMTNHADTDALRNQINALGNVVLLDEDVAGAAAPRIFADNVTGGRLAAEHLQSSGHKRIAFVSGSTGLVSVDERLAGFASALQAGGAPLDPALVLTSSYSEEFGTKAFETLWAMRDPPTAIFAAADVLAVGVLKAARRAGVRIPEQLSLVGFDDMRFADLLDPPLTTIRQDPVEFGRGGVKALATLLRNPELSVPMTRVSVALIERGSVRHAGT